MAVFAVSSFLLYPCSSMGAASPEDLKLGIKLVNDIRAGQTNKAFMDTMFTLQFGIETERFTFEEIGITEGEYRKWMDLCRQIKRFIDGKKEEDKPIEYERMAAGSTNGKTQTLPVNSRRVCFFI